MSEETSKKSSFSFGFAKKSTNKKLTDSKLREDSTKDLKDETDFVLEVNKNEIKGTIKKEIKQDLIIPCAGNTYKVIKTKNESKKEDDKPISELTEEELAARELIQDSKDWEENQAQENGLNKNLIIQVQQNAGDEKALLEADIESRPEVSSLEDYEKVKVEDFGMAILRGMGFKADEGIGGFRKAKIDCIDPVIRPKGLGLGASRATKTKNNDAGKNKEELVLKKGAFVRVENGPNKGKYGEVDGLDEETARVILRIHGNIISVSENIVQLVTKEEYKKFKNVINKDMYDKYSEKQKEREKEWNQKRQITDFNPDDQEFPEKKKAKLKESSRKKNADEMTWVRPNLRVKIIDKKSKYYKEKVTVNDVLAADKIEILTPSGRIIDMDPYDVETVIPKADFSLVMVVKNGSEFQGKVAEMLMKNGKKEKVTIRILPEKTQVCEMHFDDVCELANQDHDFY